MTPSISLDCTIFLKLVKSRKILEAVNKTQVCLQVHLFNVQLGHYLISPHEDYITLGHRVSLTYNFYYVTGAQNI